MPGEPGLQLLGNAAVTGLALGTMILAFGPVSGAHLNPLITLAGRLRGEVSGAAGAVFLGAQILGAALGVMIANLLFDLPAVSLSTTDRTGWTIWVSEAVATFGLVLVVRTVGRRGRVVETAFAVAGFVAAAIVFTPSTCFANPAVTLARTLTDTFAGIAPTSAPAFLAAQLAGALVAVACDLFLFARPASGGSRAGSSRSGELG